jgi:hypothetical protein
VISAAPWLSNSSTGENSNQWQAPYHFPAKPKPADDAGRAAANMRRADPGMTMLLNGSMVPL